MSLNIGKYPLGSKIGSSQKSLTHPCLLLPSYGSYFDIEPLPHPLCLILYCFYLKVYIIKYVCFFPDSCYYTDLLLFQIPSNLVNHIN